MSDAPSSLPQVNPVDAAVHPLIAARFSPTRFDARPVPVPALQRVLEAARWAPSSYNRQPWYFVVTQKGTPAFDRLLDTLAAANRAWAQAAPVLLLACAQTEDQRGPNRYADHDLGMASAFLALQAVAEGLATRFMAGFDKQAARAALDIPAAFAPRTVIALGYPAADADPHAKPRRRKPHRDFIGWGAWGVAPPFATPEASGAP